MTATAELDAFTRVLVVSPHFDDAVLSAWALLDDESLTRRDVLTVFGGTPPAGTTTGPDLACGFSHGDEAMRARRIEDERALSGTVTRRWWLDLLDTQYLQRARTESEAEAIAAAVAEWVAEHDAPGERLAVAIPAGAGAHVHPARTPSAAERSAPRGGRSLAWLRALKHRLYVRKRRKALDGRGPAHPDHLFVRDSILAARDRAVPAQILLYDELPYLWSVSAEAEVRALGARTGFTSTGFELPVDRVRKQERLSNYASQLTALDPPGRLHHADLLPPTEQYWRVH